MHGVLQEISRDGGSQRERRHQPMQRSAQRGRLGWQKQTGYGRRSKGETTMARHRHFGVRLYTHMGKSRGQNEPDPYIVTHTL
jgi:hypothetical protein